MLPDDDVVEMSDVPRRESFASELDLRYHEDDDGGLDNIDDSDTAKLTDNRVDQLLDNSASSTSLPMVSSSSIGNPESTFSYGKNNYNRVNVLRHTKSISRMSHMLARASTRVVNMANASQEQIEKVEADSNVQPRSTIRKSWKNNLHFSGKSGSTSDDNYNFSQDKSGNASLEQSNGRDPRMIHKLRSQPPLEGHSLYMFGPTNPIRLTLYEILNHP